MKKILLVICICASLACKKEIKDLSGEVFVLKAATVSPAMTINGKTGTDYLAISGNPCLIYNYSIVFEKDGTFKTSSGGPLCDRMPESGTQKWEKVGSQVTLTYPNARQIMAKLADRQLTYTIKHVDAGVTYEVVYQFVAK
jgi:hypothetical protein